MTTHRAELLRSASELLRQTGFQDTSMAHIADHIGISRTTLYHHFGGKSDLLAAILMSEADMARQRIAEIATYPLSPLDKLSLTIRALLRHNLENPSGSMASTYHIDSQLLTVDQRDAIVATRDHIDQLFRSLISETIESGQFRPVNVVVLANAILSACGRVASWFRPDKALSIEEVANLYTDLFVNGLKRPADDPVAPRAPSPRQAAARRSRS